MTHYFDLFLSLAISTSLQTCTWKRLLYLSYLFSYKSISLYDSSSGVHICIYTAVFAYIYRPEVGWVAYTSVGKEMKRKEHFFYVSRSFNSPTTLINDCKQPSCQMNDCKRSCLRGETVNISILQELLSLEERLGHVNRGATQDVIEMNTLPYKYKKVRFFFFLREGGGVVWKDQLFYCVCHYSYN